MLTCRELHAGQQRTLRWSQWRQSGRCQRTRWANESGWLSVRSGPGLSAAWATTKHNEPTTGSQGQSVNPAEKQKSTFSSRLIQLPLTGRDAGSQFRAKLSERKNRRETRALLQTSTITKSSPQTAGSAVSLYNDPFTQRQIRDYLRGFKRLNDSFVLSPLPSDHMKSLMRWFQSENTAFTQRHWSESSLTPEIMNLTLCSLKEQFTTTDGSGATPREK